MELLVLKVLLILVTLYFVYYVVKDFYENRNEIMTENANTLALPFSSFIIFFFSTFGVSDFAISTVLYPRLNWVNIKKLPGTLNAQCVIPVFVMALAYISSIEVGITTLVSLIIAQVVGAYIGPRFVMKLPEKTIKIFIGIGLLIASIIIVMSQLNIIPSTGNATELTGIKLVIAIILMALYGALNNIGIGSYALTMVTVYLLGLDPKVSFPIMMGACAFSVPVGSAEFVKKGEYSRKITLFTAIFGVLGVLAAVFIVGSLDTYVIKWVVVAILIYSSITMLLPEIKARLNK